MNIEKSSEEFKQPLIEPKPKQIKKEKEKRNLFF
jgi:hypothetical protein